MKSNKKRFKNIRCGCWHGGGDEGGVILWSKEYLISHHLRRWACNINSSKKIAESCICNLRNEIFINQYIRCFEILMHQTGT